MEVEVERCSLRLRRCSFRLRRRRLRRCCLRLRGFMLKGYIRYNRQLQFE